MRPPLQNNLAMKLKGSIQLLSYRLIFESVRIPPVVSLFSDSTAPQPGQYRDCACPAQQSLLKPSEK